MRKTYLLFLFSFVVLTGSISLVFANETIIKPSTASHHENIFNNADVDSAHRSSNSYDGDVNEQDTFSSVYQKYDEEYDWVVIYGFDQHQDVERATLHVNYAFPQQSVNDGFGVYYSLEGDAFCHSDFVGGEWSRNWQLLQTVTDPFSSVAHASVDLTDVADTSELCLMFDSEPVGALDDEDDLEDASRLDVYDIWLDIDPKEVDAYVYTNSLETDFYANDEVVITHSVGVLSEETDTLAVELHPADGMEVVSSSIDLEEQDDILVAAFETVEFSDPISFDVTYRFAENRFGLMGYNAYVEPLFAEEVNHDNNEDRLLFTVSAESTEPVVEQVCEAVCEDVALYTYLVNPDGSRRETYSDYARITPLGHRHFYISFEDSGSDFDYNDVVLELDVSDCTNVQVSLVSIDAGWHHEVYGSVYHNNEWVMDITIAEDTHGIVEPIAIDIRDHLAVPMCID